ncbi:cytosine permease [Acetobacter sp. DsW_063]|uniref:purine-cytosine permease family protein n=1 Tax=Acetobacter sp. DsW_063 TaxID=1514894 RepID=UPI000A3A42D4|nr:cytosine permease [Acetobacter sp. DsW_063]OUJ15135.1 thiamine permease [Acetobacter sp. DsW_063]
MSTTSQEATTTLIESETIFPVPADKRHGDARSLCLMWVGANQNILAIMTGMIYCKVLHLSLLWAAVAILAGNGVGGVFMALHAAQGPHLGVPQMQQTRGQFGAWGALLIVAVVILMYVGFTATILAIGRDQTNLALGLSDQQWPVILSALIIFILCAVGHGLIERFTIGYTYVAATSFILLAAYYAFGLHAAPVEPLFAMPTLRDFVAALSIGVLWQIAYAPYVSDYSRYLPAHTGERTAFWSCLTGSTLGTAAPTLIGAYIGSTAASASFYAELNGISSAVSLALLIVIVISTLICCTMQIYCAALSMMTFMHTFRPNWRPTHRSRAVCSAILLAASVVTTISLRGDILDIINDFIELLLAVLSPWTAINLVDYYLVRHGDYDIPSLFKEDGGIYGLVNGPAVVCYGLGILVQIPFISNALYTGAAARMLGGVDVSWITGILVPGAIYWALSILGGVRSTGRDA